MSVNVGNQVNTKGISKSDFSNAIKDMDATTQKELQSIFDHYAKANQGEGKDDNVLDESEQVMARSAFAALDTDQDSEVSRREFRSGEGSNTFMDNSLKTVGKFFNIIDSLMGSAPTDQGTLVYDNNNNLTDVLRGDGTTVTYQNSVNQWTVVPEAADESDGDTTLPGGDQETTPTAPKSNKTTFTDEASVKKALYKHLLGIEVPEGVNINLNNIAIEQDQTSGEFIVKFDNKIYHGRTDKDGDIGFYYDNPDGAGGSSLKYDIAKSTTEFDNANNLHNHGNIGNEQSTYDKNSGTINNTHGTQRAVSQTQTFASMLMNNNTGSTLALDAQRLVGGGTKKLNGEEIIKTMLGKESLDAGDGVTMSDLIRYLNAAAKESQEVTDKSGARKYAANVDIDAKDLVNLDMVFTHYDKNDDKKLDVNEMNALLNDLLTKGNTMTGIANQHIGDDQYVPAQEPETTPEPEPQPQPEAEIITGGKNFVRNVDRNPKDGIHPKDEDNHRVTYNQDSDGLRTVFTEGPNGSRIADNEGNIAMNVDHGPFGIGKKDFIYVAGLETHVDAEILHDSKIQGDTTGQLVIKVRDKNGRITYRAVSTTGDKYQISGQPLIQKGNSFITRSDSENEIRAKLKISDQNTKIPEEMSIEYDKKGKNPQITYRGRIIADAVAMTIIQRHNSG